MTDEDLDLPPASDNQYVQAFLDTYWREAVRASRESMDCIRKIYPELTEHLPETGNRHIRGALDDIEAGLRKLHLAGRHVLGQSEYEEYLEAQAARQIKSQ